MNELALFSGAGGGILGGQLLGWRTVCAVERDEHCGGILVKRQNEGHLEPFPIWTDVETFDGRPWRGVVDVVSGGFPCQDISAAGKGAGLEGVRSGLWVEMARIISEVRPKYVFVENSPVLTSRGLGKVLGDLATLGYDAEWGVMGAHHVGAPHKRDRIWVVGSHSSIKRLEGQWPDSGQEEINQFRDVGCKVSNSQSKRAQQNHRGIRERAQGIDRRASTDQTEGHKEQSSSDNVDNSCGRRHRAQAKKIQPRRDSTVNGRGWEVEPSVGRVADGVARRVDRLKALGNGQVPSVAALAWLELSRRLRDR